ncbi:hypothetical protein ACFQ0B_51865 [Nonomuraea thailandensis]
MDELFGAQHAAGGGGELERGPAAFGDGPARSGGQRSGGLRAEQRDQDARAIAQAVQAVQAEEPQGGQYGVAPVAARAVEAGGDEAGVSAMPAPAAVTP